MAIEEAVITTWSSLMKISFQKQKCKSISISKENASLDADNTHQTPHLVHERKEYFISIDVTSLFYTTLIISITNLIPMFILQFIENPTVIHVLINSALQ